MVTTPGPACTGKCLKTSHWFLPSLRPREILKREREPCTQLLGAPGGPAKGRVTARSRESRPASAAPAPRRALCSRGACFRTRRMRVQTRGGHIATICLTLDRSGISRNPESTYVVCRPLRVTFLKESQDNDLMSLESIPWLPCTFHS